MLRRSFMPALVIAAALFACGKSDEHDDAHDRQNQPLLHVHIEEISPTPPRVGRNTVTFEVHDASHEPMSGATVTVTPFMPAMGHGSDETPVVTDHGDGTYEAAPVTFSMAGTWKLTIEATKGDAKGSAEVDYDVAMP